MCKQTHQPVPNVDKLPADGKLFIDGKDRPLLIADHDVAQAAIETGLSAVVVTRTAGEQVTVPRERVKSLAQVKQPPAEIAIDAGIFNGRGITLVSLPHYNRQTHDMGEHFDVPEGVDEATCVVLEVEDLASAAVLVYDLATKTVVFQNPASEPRAIKRCVRAITLLAEAESLEAQVSVEETNMREADHGSEGFSAMSTSTEGGTQVARPDDTGQPDARAPRVIAEPRTADEVGKDSLPE